MLDVIQTVGGPIEPGQLGITLAHEHLLIDLTCLFEADPGSGPDAIADHPIDRVPRGILESFPYGSRDNLIMDDEDLAAHELKAFRDAGGQSLIDLTVEGIGPNPLALRRISQRTGVHVIAGAGIYRAVAHPAWVGEATVEQLEQRFVQAVASGIGDTDVRAGLLGELGTSSPINPDEVKVLQAAARAQRQTGAPINVHCSLFAREGPRILDILQAAGANLHRVALSHIDELLDFEYHSRLAERGAWLSFDTFGSELPIGKHREPTDAERVRHLCRMLDAGFSSQILLSQDVCTKMQLRRYGGKGYGNILTALPPELERAGVPPATIRQLLVDNPRRYLSSSR